jgi:hypothetical protein
MAPVVWSLATPERQGGTLADVNPEPREPELLPTGVLSPDRAGAAWWQYRRAELPGADAAPPRPSSAAAPPVPAPDVPTAAPPPAPAVGGLGAAVVDPSPMPFVLLALGCAGAAIALGRTDAPGVLSRILVGGFGLASAAALARFVQQRHPEEPWIGRMIVWGMVVKIGATIARYYVFFGADKRSDAQVYSRYAKEYVLGIAEPLEDLRKTNFVKYVLSHVYVVIGTDLIASFLLFGIVAFFGAYLWYRAAAEAVPTLNRKWYAAFMFFAPSIAFWPSSVGKEALMLVGLGLAALGIAKVLNGALLSGLLIAAPGGWLLWIVRPHLLAFATVAAAGALFVRRGAGAKAQGASLARPLGLVALGFLAVFALNQAASFLGMDDFSLTSIEEELADQSQNTNTGRSAFKDAEETSKVNITPLSVPQGAVTVLLRPFPWEVENSSQIIACLESAAFAWFIVWRWRSVVASLRQVRSSPYLFYCWVMLAFYAVAFASFSNMGLLVRQRSLILPAFFVLLCVEPLQERLGRRDDGSLEAGAAPVSA